MNDLLPIETVTGPIAATVDLPGSKSLTNRALVLGALGDGETHLEGALESDDTRVLVDSLERLGFAVEWDRSKRSIRMEGRGGSIPSAAADLYGGNSGTTVRFLTSLVALGNGRFRVDGDARMRERPIRDLIEALGRLGVSARSELDNGCPPVIVDARGLPGGAADVAAGTSSQYASSILMVAPYAARDVELRLTGDLVGEPFLEMTLGMMRRFGAIATREERRVRVPSGQRYGARRLAIEPDATAASYFFAAAALLGGDVTVRRLGRDSLQGDLRFLDVLAEMGAEVTIEEDRARVRGARLEGIDRDFRAISDTFLTAAVLAPFAGGPTRIRGVGHTRHQESDRVAAVARELRRLGADVSEMPDGLEIQPSTLHGGEVETYDDHRIAMSFSLIGLRVPGISIRNPSCVEKTFPDYFERLRALRGA